MRFGLFGGARVQRGGPQGDSHGYESFIDYVCAAEGYGFQVEMTYRLVSAGGKIVEFPISFHDRTEGTSKMSGNIIHEALLLVMKLWLSDFRGRRSRRSKGH